MDTLLISNILVTDRQRRDLGDLDSDFSNVREIGLIQPIVVEPLSNSNQVRLISGGRRLAWLESNGFTTLFHGTTCNPEKPGFVFSYELTEQQRQEAELYENLKRKKLHWVEECQAIAKIHRMRWIENKAQGLDWSQIHTGQLLGIGSRSKVSYCLMVADELRENPDGEVSKCEQYSDAVKMILNRKDRELRAEQEKRNAKLQAPQTVTTINEEGQLVEVTPSESPSEPEIVQIWLSHMFYLGDFATIAETEFPPDVYPCALLFGDTSKAMEQTLRLLREHSYAFLFGFDALEWAKSGRTSVIWNILGLDPQPEEPFRDSTRIITVLKKGQPIPANPSPTNVVSANADGIWPPTAVLDFLLRAVTIPGDSILLPTGGPIERVFEVGRRPVCFETDKEKHEENMEKAKEWYRKLYNERVEFL